MSADSFRRLAMLTFAAGQSSEVGVA